MTKARSLPSRRSTTGPTISGMTSPALRRPTVSPMSTPFGPTSLALCSVAMPHRRPGYLDWLHHAERSYPARTPDVDADVEQLGRDLFRQVLIRDRPARSAGCGAD